MHTDRVRFGNISFQPCPHLGELEKSEPPGFLLKLTSTLESRDRKAMGQPLTVGRMAIEIRRSYLDELNAEQVAHKL